MDATFDPGFVAAGQEHLEKGATIGFLVSQDKEKVCLAHDLFEEEGARGVTSIPRGVIKKVVPLGDFHLKRSR